MWCGDGSVGIGRRGLNGVGSKRWERDGWAEVVGLWAWGGTAAVPLLPLHSFHL